MEDLNQFLEIQYLSNTFKYILYSYFSTKEQNFIFEFLRDVKNFDYAITGKFAVSLWSYGERKVSFEDFAVCIPRRDKYFWKNYLLNKGYEIKELIHQKFFIARKSLFLGCEVWLHNEDFMIEGIKNAKVFNYKNLKIKVLPAEFLTLYKFKFYSHDLKYLLRSGKIDLKKIENLAKKYLPQFLEQLKEEIIQANKRYQFKDLNKILHFFEKEKRDEEDFKEFIKELRDTFNGEENQG